MKIDIELAKKIGILQRMVNNRVAMIERQAQYIDDLRDVINNLVVDKVNDRVEGLLKADMN